MSQISAFLILGVVLVSVLVTCKAESDDSSRLKRNAQEMSDPEVKRVRDFLGKRTPYGYDAPAKRVRDFLGKRVRDFLGKRSDSMSEYEKRVRDFLG